MAEKGSSTMLIGLLAAAAGLVWYLNRDVTCSEDADCADNQKCVNTACVDDCTADSDCGTDETCVDGDCVAATDNGNGDATDPLESFNSHSNKSLYPGWGLSDLYKPGRESITGLTECAKKCLEDDNCAAFHHWSAHPEEDTKDTCFYWSANQHETETYENVSDALGPGDEGKGDGYQVDAYIKKVETSAADTWLGYRAESMFINTLQDHQIW